MGKKSKKSKQPIVPGPTRDGAAGSGQPESTEESGSHSGSMKQATDVEETQTALQAAVAEAMRTALPNALTAALPQIAALLNGALTDDSTDDEAPDSPKGTKEGKGDAQPKGKNEESRREVEDRAKALYLGGAGLGDPVTSPDAPSTFSPAGKRRSRSRPPLITRASKFPIIAQNS